jgi:hypothetical protein
VLHQELFRLLGAAVASVLMLVTLATRRDSTARADSPATKSLKGLENGFLRQDLGKHKKDKPA